MTGSISGILFTDIDGSVAKWDRFPDHMAVALARHDELITSVIIMHGGRIQDRAGDGFLVRFEGGNPLACALDIQSAFRQADWSTVAGLSVRISVHATVDDDGAHLQPAINRAARMVNAAWGGQIVVSATSAAIYETPAGGRLNDLGSAHLRDIASPLRLFSLTGADWIDETFPPLRGVERQTPNLPLQSTPIFGRQRELIELTSWIGNGKRAVSIVAAGGMGKTRLAIEVARVVSTQREVCFVVLPGEETNSDDLASALITALRLPQIAGASPRNGLLSYLRSRDILIVVDNADGVADESRLFEAIADSCARASLLVTSRKSMGWRDEAIYRLGGLRSSSDETDFSQSAAGMLFAQAARVWDPNFAFDVADEAALVAMCEAVRGAPLALQLMAQWLPIMSVREIATKLSTGEAKLSEFQGEGPALREVFNGSWNLLDGEQRSALAALSVFPVDFDQAAAQYVAGVSQKVVLALERRSLLERRAHHRLALHPLTKEFAAEQLASTRKGVLLSAQAQYFRQSLRSLAQMMRGPEAPKGTERARLEIENLRAALKWLAQDVSAMANIAAFEDAFYIFAISGMFAEGLGVFEEPPADRGLRGAFLAYRGNCLAHLGRLEEAEAACREALALADDDEKRTLGHAHQGLANVLHWRAEWGAAYGHYAEALALRVDDPLGRAYTTISLASLELHRGGLTQALEWIEQSDALCKSLGFSFGTFVTCECRGDLELRRGQTSDALTAYRAALSLEEALSHTGALGVVYAKLAHCQRVLNDSVGARASLDHALALAEQSGEERLRARVLTGLASLQDRPSAERRELFWLGLRGSFQARSALDVSRALLEGAWLEAQSNNVVAARQMYLAARALNVGPWDEYTTALVEAKVDVSPEDSGVDAWNQIEMMIASRSMHER